MPFSNLLKKVNLFLDDKPAVFALRQKARKSIPSTTFQKQETWKYTDISPILKTTFAIDTEQHNCEHNCCHETEQTSPFIKIKFCHGKLHIKEFNTPEGLHIIPLPIALYDGDYKKYLFNSFDLEKHPFAALNGTYLEQGICIHVEENVHLNKPLLIEYNQTHCEQIQINLHNIIILEKNAQLELLETFSSTNSNSYLTNIVNEIYLKADSKFHHYKKQQESASAYHIAFNAIKIQNNAQYTQFYYANGAKISRQESLINLMQQGADAQIYTAYRAKKDCLTDITTNINHLKAETTSNQYAKAVLDSNSAATFQGKIYIAPNAEKTNGNQLHKGLYLNDSAVLNCKPELEIYADNVKCSHGASCGELDKEQLFYLTSRGINESLAKQMLIDAHLAEIFDLIPNKTIQQEFTSD